MKRLSTPYVYEVIVAFFLVFGGVANGIRGLNPSNPPIVGWLWLISAGGVLAVSVAKSLAMWAVHTERESTHELSVALHVLHALLTSDPKFGSDRVRITIHVPVEKGQFFQQVTDYVGDKYRVAGGGRKFPIQCGIIGKAYKERKPQVGIKQSEDYDGFLEELQRDWGYSLPEAIKVDPLSKTWMAVPILTEESPVYGILYADSTASTFFDENRQAMVFSASTGIADYVVRRYKS